jgi:sugar phosphate isomerase/epimerase
MIRQTVFSRRTFFAATAATAVAATCGWSAGGEPPAYQIGCYTRPWDQNEYRVALDGIAEAGYKYAGIMTAKGKTWVMITPQTPVEEAAAIGEEVKKRGLRTISLYADFSVARSLEEGIGQLRRNIDNCAACGSPNLLLGGTGDPRLYDNYFKAVAECCDYAVSKKVAMSVKPHGGQNATGPQCRKAIEKVGHKNFGLWYDPGNIFYYSDGKLDPVDDSRTVDGLVMGMSVKDFLPPKEVAVTPGTGKVDFKTVFANLKRGGFVRGPLVVECLARGTVAQITAEAVKARKFLEELTK